MADGLPPAYSGEPWGNVDARRAVCLEVVASKTYRANVRKAVGRRAAQIVHMDIARMLRHRSGTAYEDLYAYDLVDGTRLGSVVNASAPKEVLLTDALRVAIAERVAKGGSVALVHNHPDSLPPSAADIKSLISTQAKRGVIACHDGSLYVFEITGSSAPGYTADDKTLRMIGCLRGSDEDDLLRGYEESLGVHVEHLR